MINGDSYQRLAKVAQQWRDLAEKRRLDFTELYESGRWKRYYTDDRLLLRMQEVVASADGWKTIAGSFVGATAAPLEPEAMTSDATMTSEETTSEVLPNPRDRAAA